MTHLGKAGFDSTEHAIALGRAQATAEIVGWLRKESARIQILMADEIGMTDMRIGVQLKVDRLADAVERGDHIKA